MWQRLKLALCCALLAAATGVAVQAILLLHAATVAARALPGAVSDELQVTRVDLVEPGNRRAQRHPRRGRSGRWRRSGWT